VRYHALACDYDGTIAEDGALALPTRAALERWRASGRLVVLVTGRRLDDLERVCPDLSTFDAVVAENGAVYLRPPEPQPRVLGPPPPEALLAALRARGVEPIDPGAVIVATTEANEDAVRGAIHALGLDLHVILNKGSVMVLPEGIDKGTGRDVALADLGLRPPDVIAVGDAENDGPLLAGCGLAVAVGDAIADLQAQADVVTRGGAGAGVVELIGGLLD
jgi:hydroxymethylpyrimidine pyrophosphatase-like HAD family hydrolase